MHTYILDSFYLILCFHSNIIYSHIYPILSLQRVVFVTNNKYGLRIVFTKAVDLIIMCLIIEATPKTRDDGDLSNIKYIISVSINICH